MCSLINTLINTLFLPLSRSENIFITIFLIHYFFSTKLILCKPRVVGLKVARMSKNAKGLIVNKIGKTFELFAEVVEPFIKLDRENK